MLTVEAVRALAPDGSALRAAQSLASPARWSSIGRSERALWGSCQGSGKDPYLVSVDVGGEAPASKCTCPSRKFPCKHALGLMLLAASNPSALAMTAPPAATTDWLAGRDARAKAAPARRTAGDGTDSESTPVVDEKARARRIATRERRVEAGLEELRLWLTDLARRGLAEVVSEGIRPFETMAARLVDAQAPSIARAIRGVGWRASESGHGLSVADVADVDWADDLLDVIGRQYLLVETYGRRESLAEAMRADVRALVGWTTREADLPEDDSVEDDWLVLGRRHLGDERLRATRTYLRARTTGRDAVLLDWEPTSSVPSNEPPVGAQVHGRLVFYPSATPLRAAVRGTLEEAGSASAAARELVSTAAGTWRDAIAPYARALAANPWLDRRPIVVSSVVPVQVGETTLYRDATGATVPTRFAEPAIDSLRAFSGGHPVTLFGEWNGRTFTVLAAAAGDVWVPLLGTSDMAPTVVVGSVSTPENPTWNALRGYAILGTSRAAPGPELQPLLVRMADRTAEEQVLALAASLAVRRRAQANVVAVGEATPLEPAAPETAMRASAAAARVLGQWLGEPVVVRDWLDRAAARGVLVPAELLPSVLEVPGVTRRADARAVLGRRWPWLTGATSGVVDAIARAQAATATPEFLAALGDQSAPASRFGAEIAEVLRPFRAHDPAAARSWLDVAWASLSAKARDGAVRALEEGIGPGDAALLDRLIAEERSKARREDLVTLALRAPGSDVGARIEERARRLVGIRGLINRSIDITPPGDDVLAAMEAEGLTMPSYGLPLGGAMRAAAQVQHVVEWHLARVAPARWSERLKLKPAEVVGAFAGLKRSGHVLVNALRVAAIGHHDAEFAEAILATGPVGGYGWVGTGLWAVIRDDARERLMVKLLFDNASTDWHLVSSLDEALAACPRPWSPGLVTLVRHEIGRSSSASPAGPNAAYAARGRLKAIAAHAPPELLPELEERVAASAANVQNAASLDDVLEIVLARRSLDAAFAN